MNIYIFTTECGTQLFQRLGKNAPLSSGIRLVEAYAKNHYKGKILSLRDRNGKVIHQVEGQR